MTKPTIVLVPGAWHTNEHFASFSKLLNEAGYESISKQLPSVGSADPRKQSISVDTEFIRSNVLLPELDKGKDVLVVAHSYGGAPLGAAIKGLSKQDRNAAGLDGGVIGYIGVAAFVFTDGQVAATSLEGRTPIPPANEETGQIDVLEPMKGMFWPNVADSEEVDRAYNLLRPFSQDVWLSPSPAPGWSDAGFDGRRAHIFTGQDMVVTMDVQRDMIGKSGKKWRELHLEDADHSPFLSCPEKLAAMIEGLASEFQSIQ